MLVFTYADTFCSKLGPVSVMSRKVFALEKAEQNLKFYDYRAVLFTYP